MNIFIDTNIYLNFFDLSNEDITELSKIQVLQQKGDIIIYLPEQVEREFFRNREGKIKRAVDQFKEDSLKDKIPNMVKTYPEYEDLKNAKDSYKTAKSALLTKIDADIRAKTLGADSLIQGIFDLAVKIPTSDEIYEVALRRHNIGDPPGKKDSLGDSIIWEALKIGIKIRANRPQHLFVISSDGDFQSELDAEQPKNILIYDWNKEYNADLYFFDRISLFTKKYFPDINIQFESEKQLSVERFINSSSYSETHFAIADLSKYQDFSANQVVKMLMAVKTNFQIRNIGYDEDVFNFIVSLMELYESQLSEELLFDIAHLYSPYSSNDNMNTKIRELQEKHSIPF